MKNSLKLQLLVMMWEWCRDRDRGGRDYYSPSCSRSVSRSESPCDDKHYRSNHNSKGPRQNDQSPRSKRDCGSDKRTFSPMRNDQSLRSPSPRENDRHGCFRWCRHGGHSAPSHVRGRMCSGGWEMIVLLVMIPNTIVIRWKRMNLRIRYMEFSEYFCLTRSMNYSFSEGLP